LGAIQPPKIRSNIRSISRWNRCRDGGRRTSRGRGAGAGRFTSTGAFTGSSFGIVVFLFKDDELISS